MMNIEILGPGCQRCRALTANTEEALRRLGLEAKIEKVTDHVAILQKGVMMTPGLVVDGQVKASGHVCTVEEIMALLA